MAACRRGYAGKPTDQWQLLRFHDRNCRRMAPRLGTNGQTIVDAPRRRDRQSRSGQSSTGNANGKQFERRALLAIGFGAGARHAAAIWGGFCPVYPHRAAGRARTAARDGPPRKRLY